MMTHQSEEINGLLFQVNPDNTITILDLSYQMQVGVLKLEEGPGWVLTDIAPFLDYGHFFTLSKYIEGLKILEDWV